MRVSVYECEVNPLPYESAEGTKIAEFHWRSDAWKFAEWWSKTTSRRLEVRDLETGKVQAKYFQGSELIPVPKG